MKSELTLDRVNHLIKTTSHHLIQTSHKRARDHRVESVRVLTAWCGANLLEPDEGSACLACHDTIQAQRFSRYPSFDRTCFDLGSFDEAALETLNSPEGLSLTAPYYCSYPLSAHEGPISPYWASPKAIEIAISWEALCQANLPERCGQHNVLVRSGTSFVEQRIDPFVFDIHGGAVVGIPLCPDCIRYLEAHDTAGWHGYEL